MDQGFEEKPTVTIPRSVVDYNKKEMSLHGFSDASKRGICAAVYVGSKYSDASVTQNLLVSKSRIAPRDTSIPRLELVAAFTLAKLLKHTGNTLHSYPIAETHMWVDSITVLYWLQHKGKWSRYVNNRVQKIHDLTTGSWHYVPTAENPSDLGTREATPARMDGFWLKGPNWLRRVADWPPQPVVEEKKAVQTEITPKRDRALLENEQMDNTQEGWTNKILQKHKYWKLLRITAFVQRFINNCRNESKKSGPLNTEEMELAEQTWVALAQKGCELQNNVPIKKDKSGIWRWHGRVPGYHPIFLPRQHKLTELVVEHYHQQNLHGGVQFTMNKVREKFWIPRLRRMANKQRFNCNRCKKLRARPLPAPPMSALPSYRADLVDAFAATGVDFAGPLYHKLQNADPGKAYVALFTCASTRAVHLKLCTDMTVIEFKRALKEFVARRGAPQMMVSDNAKTFIATKTWLENLQQDEDLNNYLAAQAIKWRFNLSRAPWWGGFFERLVGIMKSCLSKVVGKALLTFAELEETLLDIECFMNNRPLCYMGEEFDQPTITPNILIRGKPSTLLEENFETLDDTSEVTRRLRYLKKCRQQLRKRWIAEYLHALEERCRAQKTTATKMPKEGSVVLVKDYIKNHGKWKLGRVVSQIYGKDNVLRGFKIQMGSGYVLERPTQLIADLEIGENSQQSKNILNPNAAEFQPRRQPERAAKNTEQNRILGIAMNELEEN